MKVTILPWIFVGLLVVLTVPRIASGQEISAQCPTLTVVGPPGVTAPGNEMNFRAEVSVVGTKLGYSWLVDKGTIVSGQATPEIAVATDRSLAGQAITATVRVEGLPQLCESAASETAGVDQGIICVMPSDQWGEMKPDGERGRLDMFFAELANNPADVGLIIFRVKEGDKVDRTSSRIKFVLKHVRFRKFDKNRFWFAFEVDDERSTVLWRILPGGENPCANCTIFRGESL